MTYGRVRLTGALGSQEAPQWEMGGASSFCDFPLPSPALRSPVPLEADPNGEKLGQAEMGFGDPATESRTWDRISLELRDNELVSGTLGDCLTSPEYKLAHYNHVF